MFFVDSVSEGRGERSFDPARDMGMLRRRLAEIGDVKLLIVDPIVSVISNDSHKNAEVRNGLRPLVDLAAAMRCAVLGITHFSKGTAGRDPVERLNGSIAFGAVAHLVWITVKRQAEDEEGSATRLLVRAKSNIGPDGDGFTYKLEESALQSDASVRASQIIWDETVEGNVCDLLARAEQVIQDSSNALSDAIQFLIDLLSDGPVPSNTVQASARAAGHSWATIRRASEALDIKKTKTAMSGGWQWSLPRRCSNDGEEVQPESMNIFGGTEHLHDDAA